MLGVKARIRVSQSIERMDQEAALHKEGNRKASLHYEESSAQNTGTLGRSPTPENLLWSSSGGYPSRNRAENKTNAQCQANSRHADL